MEYLRGYRVITEDPDWTSKFLWACLAILSAMFIPLLGQIVLVGWQARIMQNAVRGIRSPLPPLEINGDLLGKLLGLGFKGFIVRFVWQIPYMLLIGGAVVVMYAALIIAATNGDEDVIPIIMMVYLASMLVLMPIGFVLMIPSQSAALRAELTGDMKAGLNFGEVMGFTKRNFGVLFKGTFILGFVGALLGFLGMLVCVGGFPAAVASLIAQAHFLAQVYEADVANGNPPLELEHHPV